MPPGPAPDAAPRHQQRERALSLLYEAEMKGESPLEVLDALAVPPDPYVRSLLVQVATTSEDADRRIAGAAEHWPLDRMAVVDQRCRLRGVENLRVVDASVIPAIPRANINLTCIMIGERVSDWMRDEA